MALAGAERQGKQRSYRHELGHWHSVGLRCWPQVNRWQRMRVEKQVRARLQRLDYLLYAICWGPCFICGQWEPLEVMKMIIWSEKIGAETDGVQVGRGEIASRSEKQLLWVSSLAVGNQKERTQIRVTIWRKNSQKEKNSSDGKSRKMLGFPLKISTWAARWGIKSFTRTGILEERGEARRSSLILP